MVETLHIGGYCPSPPISVSSDHGGSLRSAMVGAFPPQKLASATNQDFIVLLIS